MWPVYTDVKYLIRCVISRNVRVIDWFRSGYSVLRPRRWRDAKAVRPSELGDFG